MKGEKKDQGDEEKSKLRSKIESMALGDPVVRVVRQIRQQRMLSVQGPEQFSSIYEALKQQWIERYPRIVAAYFPLPVEVNGELSNEKHGTEAAYGKDTNDEEHRVSNGNSVLVKL